MVRAAAAVAALLALAVPASARADLATLDGTPLNVYADGLGEIQVRVDGQAKGLFYDPDANPAHAGFELKEGDQYFPLQHDFDTELGRTGTEPATVSGQGTGTQTIHSSYNIGQGPDLHVTEDITYVNGTSQVAIHYTVTNLLTTPTSVRAGELADLYVGANDNGNGVSAAGPPRFVGGRDEASGLVTGLQEVTGWGGYQEGDFGDVFASFSTDGLTDTVDPNAPDNGVGVQFSLDNLAPGETRPVDVRWLISSSAPPGTGSPGPLAGAGSNATARQLPPPVAGKTVNLHLANGVVLYKTPGSTKFLKLTEDVQVPLGTTLDTTHGRVTLISAADLKGTSQHAWFYDGVFKVGQTKGAKPITRLAIPRDLKCAKAKSSSASAAAKKPKKRKLWGDGSGSFRTEGHFSSATVRGTKWVVIDTCDTTMTRVVRGVIAVRDSVRHRTIVLRAGKQYVAHKKK